MVVPKFCGQCGSALVTGARFCSACGSPVVMGAVAGKVPWMGSTATGGGTTQLARSRVHGMVAGVCAGLAQRYGWDVSLVRVLAVVIALFSGGAGGLAYIIFWIIMPEQVPEAWTFPSTPMSSATTPATAPLTDR